MKRIFSVLIGALIVVSFLFGCATVGKSQTINEQSSQNIEVVVTTKAFTFFDQTFQVPVSWPSEDEMRLLPMETMVEGDLTEYAFIQELYPGSIVYWFMGIETDSEFVIKLLTQTLILSGYGVVDCEHWVVNSDGTITQLDCEEFGELIGSLIDGVDGSI